MAQGGQLHEKLKWLIENIEKQLQEKKIQLQFYWDSEHVMRAVLGMADFYMGGQFDKDTFEDKKTLIVCLAAAGWFGPIWLLPPHRAEFYKRFKSEFGVGDDRVPPDGARQLFRDCGLGQIPALDLVRQNPDRQAEIVNQYAGRAQQLFKAVACAYGDWKTRLASMYTSGQLSLDSADDVDYTDLFDEPVFMRARDVFEAKKSEKFSSNNLADAIALCMLVRQSEVHERHCEMRPPRFFDTNGVFKQAFEHAVGSATEGMKSIFQDADYYLFRAMFEPPGELVQDGEHDKFIEALVSAYEKVKNVVGSWDLTKPLDAERVDEICKIDVGGILLPNVIEDLEKCSFLERVWLPYAHKAVLPILDVATGYAEQSPATKTSNAYLRSFVETENQLTGDEGFDTAVKNTMESLGRSLEEHVVQFRSMSDLFQKFEHGLDRFRSNEQSDVLKSSGLIRFGVPDEYQGSIRDIAANFGDKRLAIPRMVRMYRDAEHHKADNASRHVLACLLWILNMHDLINRLFDGSAGEASWLWALNAASTIELRDFRGASRKIEVIEKRYNQLDDLFARSEEAIRLAYLYFHMWRDGGGVVKWRHQTPPERGHSTERINLWIRLAIEFAKDAYAARHRDASKETYALNQYLYYVTEGGDDESFRRMTRIAQELLNRKAKSVVWQYRYDDTLARYFHRQSTRAATLEQKRDLLIQAKEYIRDAVRDADGDPEVKAYESIIVNAEVELNEELSQAPGSQV